MRKFFVNEKQIKDNCIDIVGEDINHIKNVLRFQVGEKLKICDSDNMINYICEISDITSDVVKCNIIGTAESEVEGNVELHIYQGLPKADKMELIIQKGTELGVTEFIPVAFKRSIVKLNGKDEIKKIERWQKISEVASKQSGRDIIPKVNNIIKVKDICEKIKEYDIVLLAYELEEDNYIKEELLKIKAENKKYKIAIVIGPEGGVDQEELIMLKNAGAKVITLGKRILRTETVALQVTSVIMYELENNGGN